jgi:hypothetical protein
MANSAAGLGELTPHALTDIFCDLLDTGADDDTALSKHALEEVVARLRKKLRAMQAAGAEPAIKSVWGVGYQLCISISFA